jgi:hypothetical protein
MTVNVSLYLLIALTAVVIRPTPALASGTENVPTSACEALTSADLTGLDEAPTRISSARVVEAEGGEPAFCYIRGYVAPQVGFELQLPLQGWNGRFLLVGCGGACGYLESATWCPLYRGYACVFTDMGHQSQDGAPDDGLWAYNNLQAQVDFGYRATHVATVAGKAITERYYKRPPTHSYLFGCSTGSRQGLVEAQRFPWDFEGIIAGGVWIDNTMSTSEFVWGSRALRPSSGPLPLAHDDLQLLHESALKKCDMDDGVKDGLISNPLACNFDPAELRCKRGATAHCLTDAQIEAAKKVYSGPTTSYGTRLTAGGALPGSEHRWILEPGQDAGGGEYVTANGTLSAVELSATEYFRWMVDPPAGSEWTISTFNFDEDYKRFFNGVQESLLSDTNPDLRRFKSAGGKLMLYVGGYEWSLPRTAADYYQTVEKVMGGAAATKDFFRLFLIPGMNHCTGGDGAFAVDYLSYMETWVEKGQAPDSMIGAHIPGGKRQRANLRFPLDASVPVSFTRPIYPYPMWARYKGSGNPNRAENFEPAVECKDHHLPGECLNRRQYAGGPHN